MDEAKIQQVINNELLTTVDKHIELNGMKRVPLFGLLYPWERKQVYIAAFFIILIVVLLLSSIVLSDTIARFLLSVTS